MARILQIFNNNPSEKEIVYISVLGELPGQKPEN
jgi:hypothetical protein